MITLSFLASLLGSGNMYAQTAVTTDSLAHVRQDTTIIDAKEIDLQNKQQLEALDMHADTARITADAMKQEKSVSKTGQVKPQWVPNPNKAIWLSLMIPGAGQIYNRKYWKLPIVYGGFVGCVYALNWNSQMYNDYTQAYLDIMDDNPNTNSFEDFIGRGVTITESNLAEYQERFKSRKDLYRRQRDLSIIAFIGVYVLSIIDAYVDAELSDFDISKDLGLKIEPAIFNDIRTNKPISGVGLQCSLNF